MAIFGENLRTAFLKGIEALGKGASSLADGAQKKLDEMNLETRRREILAAIPKCVSELYAQGVELPQQLTDLLGELKELEEKIKAMRPQPAPVEEPAAEEAEEGSAEEAAPAEEAAEEACECGCEEAPAQEPAEETVSAEEE